MTIERIQQDMIAALKAHDTFTKDILAGIIATAKNMAIAAGEKDEISPETTTKAVLKELKTAKEMIDTCPSNRADLMDTYLRRYEIINRYAPQMMSADDIRKTVRELISSHSLTSKGQAMKIIMPQLKGKADGKLIAQIVTEELANG